jgi:hypothetical protein
MSTSKEVAEAFTESDDPADTFITATPTSKSARVKGTWDMYWSTEVYKFVDKQRYTIPIDLYDYLAERDCIYDTV